MFHCQVCGEEDQDCRTLKLAFHYRMTEISEKFQRESDDTYSIRCCKNCRGNFLGILRYWIEGNLAEHTTNPKSSIPVRVDGRVVMMSQEEWTAHTTKLGEPDRKPQRLF